MTIAREWPQKGVDLIAEERARQIAEEGYSLEHDRNHGDGALAYAAAVYAAPEPIYRMEVHSGRGGRDEGEVAWWEPWPRLWARPELLLEASPEDRKARRIRDLTKAGALIAAELDRINRIGEENGNG